MSHLSSESMLDLNVCPYIGVNLESIDCRLKVFDSEVSGHYHFSTDGLSIPGNAVMEIDLSERFYRLCQAFPQLWRMPLNAQRIDLLSVVWQESFADRAKPQHFQAIPGLILTA
jgi:hypothetical protein